MVRKSTKAFCGEFENLYTETGFKLEGPVEVEVEKSKSFKCHTTTFREDDVEGLSDMVLNRKGSILKRLESNHFEKSNV
jgi:hypothetical protein